MRNKTSRLWLPTRSRCQTGVIVKPKAAEVYIEDLVDNVLMKYLSGLPNEAGGVMGNEAVEVVFTGIAALIIGFVFGFKSGAKTVVPTLKGTSYTQAIDRANYLQTLRRELANILVWHNPQKYLSLYQQLLAEITSFGSWRPEAIQKRLAELSQKYPIYSDFDVIATREYVLYPDGVSLNGDAELESHYRDIVTFSPLSVIADPAWKEAASRGFIHKLSDKELVHLTEYVRKIENTKLRLRIEQAVEAYFAHRDEQTGVLDNDFFSVRPLHHFAENRYAIHLKRMGEFAIYSFFMFDDGRTTDSYYRSDPSFELEHRLDVLHSVLEEVKTAAFGQAFGGR